MARTFNGSTSNYLIYTGTEPVNAAPLTFAVWAKFNNLSSGRALLGILDESSTEGWHVRYGNAANSIEMSVVRSGTGTASGAAGISPSTGVWHHCVGIDDGSNVIGVQDGDWANRGTAAHSTSPRAAFVDSVEVGIRKWSATPDLPHDGDIAWPCIWNVALSQGEIEALAAGAHPLSVRPEAIVFFAPLTGASSGDEIDIIGGLTLTETGTVGTSESPLVSIGTPILVRGQAGSATNINATTDALTLTENAASLALNINANVDTLTLTEYASTLAQNITTTVDALTLTENAASLQLNLNAQVNALTLTEFASTISRNVSANVDALTLTTYAATITAGNVLSANVHNLLLTEHSATLSQNLNANIHALTLTEHTASLTVQRNIAANVDALTLTEYVASLNVTVNANVDALTLTTFSATITYASNISANVHVLTLTTYQATITGTEGSGTKGGGPSSTTVRRRLLKQLQYDDEQVLALYMALKKRRRR